MDMLRRGVALLTKRRDFGLLMGVQFLAQAGDGVVQTALATVIAFGGQQGFDPEAARTPDELLRIVLYTLVPYTILSPFLGVVIDRWDRRLLLIVANGLRAAVVGLIAVWGVSDVGDVPLFLAFLLTLMSTRVVLATKAAALPETVESDALLAGNAVSQLGGALFQLGGAAVALVAKALLPADPIVLAGAAVYAAGAVFALPIRKVGEPRARTTLGQEVARVVRNIANGVRAVAATPKAGASISTYFWLRFIWSYTLVGIGFVARELLAGDDLLIAALVGGAGALGAALGFLSAGIALKRVDTKARLVLSAAGVVGIAIAVLGGIGSIVALPVLTFFLGLGFFLAKISLDTMVQEALGDDFRGRAFSLYDIAYNLAWVLAAGIMKVVWAEDLTGVLIAGMGVVFLAGMAALGAWFKRAGLLATRLQVEEVRL